MIRRVNTLDVDLMRVYTCIMENGPCLCTALRQAALASTAHYDQVLAPSGLKVTMYRLLKNLHALDRPNISHLAERVGLDRSTLGRNVRVLERDGFVARVGSDDERERLIALTTKGRNALEQARPLWAKAQRQMARRLDDRAAELLEILQQLNR